VLCKDVRVTLDQERELFPGKCRSLLAAPGEGSDAICRTMTGRIESQASVSVDRSTERRHIGGCWVVVSGDSTEPPIHCLVADTTHWTEGFLRSTGHLRV
jgi:hypothetical protein